MIGVKIFRKKVYRVKTEKNFFRKTKKFHIEIYKIHHIHFQSALEIYLLGFYKNQNAKLCIFSGTNHNGYNPGGSSAAGNISFQLNRTWSRLKDLSFYF